MHTKRNEKISGIRFIESRRSRNEHLDIRLSRAIICRCFKSMYLYGHEYLTSKRWKRGPVYRSKYNIRTSFK